MIPKKEVLKRIIKEQRCYGSHTPCNQCHYYDYSLSDNTPVGNHGCRLAEESPLQQWVDVAKKELKRIKLDELKEILK